MKFVGNDIIDLTIPAVTRKSRDIRFIKRVFTAYEEREIFRSENPDRLLWLLWAAKEASYKVISKFHPDANSIPRCYEVYLESDDASPEKSGVVLSPFELVQVRTYVCGEYIHCIGISGEEEDWNSIVWKVEKVDSEGLSTHGESRLIREMLRRDLSQFLSANPEDVEILRKKGPDGLDPPRVYLKDQKSAIDISMSHDGSFIAYSFLQG